MGNSFVAPPNVFILVTTPSYISLIVSMYLAFTLFLSRTHQRTSLGTLSYAFSKSMNTI
ncbi:hypothetical protein Scep_030187 [Stephania cephalantha]|uniref:Uncharacterized protein n=1 Tax=Stephania cephalantha TaxID=152367 RepID=A0AAP0HGM7_9MAGN